MNRRLLNGILVVAILLLSQASSPLMANYTVTSPDGRKKICLETEKSLKYSVFLDETVLIAPTEIAMSVKNRGMLGRDSKVVSVQKKILYGEYRPPFYKKESVDLAGNELLVRFEGDWAVELRAFDDGVAYRFRTDYPDDITILGEIGGLTLPGDPTGFFPYDHEAYQGDYFQGNWENVYNEIPASRIDSTRLVFTPVTLRLPSDIFLAFSEADLKDYPGLNLKRPETQTEQASKDGVYLEAIFAKRPKTVKRVNCNLRVLERENEIAVTTGSRTFPWRCFFISPSAAKLLESDLVAKLAEPSRIDDTSWIRPGKAAWDWWDKQNLSGVDFLSGHNTETYKTYIDFAAEHGLEYVLFDAGWAVYTSLFDIKPSIDMDELIRYAEEKNVGIILWCFLSQVLGVEDELFEYHARKGIRGFKIDFFDRDDQEIERVLYRFAELGAKHKMVLLLHGMHKPGGIQFTWPNILSCEGVFGLETNKYHNVDLARNDTVIPFTRMLSGPMDYTPGTMNNATKSEYRVNHDYPMGQGTRVHQMAMPIMFESPITVFSDNPMSYRQSIECFRFMAAIPDVWDETIGISGEIGKNVVLARRKGSDWYLSALGNWEAQTLKTSLDFLGQGDWQLEYFRDGVNAHKNARDYKRGVTFVTSNDKIYLPLAPGGGWAGKFRPVTRSAIATPASNVVETVYHFDELNFASYFANKTLNGDEPRYKPHKKNRERIVQTEVPGIVRIPISREVVEATFSAVFSQHVQEGCSGGLLFEVIGDGKILWSGTLNEEEGSEIECHVDLSGTCLAEIYVSTIKDIMPDEKPSVKAIWKNARWTIMKRQNENKVLNEAYVGEHPRQLIDSSVNF